MGYVLCTTPKLKESVEGMSDWGIYMGKNDDTDDIKIRLQLINDVLQRTIPKATTASDTLKVFTIPEFFWRGVKGAYRYSDPASDDMYKKIQDGLTSILNTYGKSYDLSDWLFVFGTILTTPDSPDVCTEMDKTLAKVGDDFLNVYSLIKGISKSNLVGSLSHLLRIADRKESATTTDDEKLSALLTDMLDMSDALAVKKVYNRCLIYYGSQTFHIQKQYKSKEDFILNNPSEDKKDVNYYLQTMVNYPPIEEGSAVCTLPLSYFTCGNLNIGIEICLDHSRKRLKGYTYEGKIPQLDIQIIPSCGMQLKKDSIATHDGGLLFNCDGEYTLEDQAQNGEYSHSELKRSSFTPSCGPRLSEQLPVQEIVSLTDICVDELFPHGAGQIHIYNEQTL